MIVCLDANLVIYLVEAEGTPILKLLSAYADGEGGTGHPERLQIGEGLIGQCAADARRVLLTELPDNVVPIRSGLYKITPTNLFVLPVLFMVLTGGLIVPRTVTFEGVVTK